MENPADYDIDKDMGEDEVDETKIGEYNQEITKELKQYREIKKKKTINR